MKNLHKINLHKINKSLTDEQTALIWWTQLEGLDASMLNGRILRWFLPHQYRYYESYEIISCIDEWNIHGRPGIIKPLKIINEELT